MEAIYLHSNHTFEYYYNNQVVEDILPIYPDSYLALRWIPLSDEFRSPYLPSGFFGVTGLLLSSW